VLNQKRQGVSKMRPSKARSIVSLAIRKALDGNTNALYHKATINAIDTLFDKQKIALGDNFDDYNQYTPSHKDFVRIRSLQYTRPAILASLRHKKRAFLSPF
jgi:hypothetical protein